MGKIPKATKIPWLIFLLSVIFVGHFSKKLYYFRWIGYESIPGGTAILDEKNYVSAGYSFRKTGIPTAWSNLDAYVILAKEKKRANSTEFNGISITLGGNTPDLKNKKNFDYPIIHVADVDIGKGQESILIVQPFFDHSPLSGIFYSLGVKNPPRFFADFKMEEYRKGALVLGILTSVLLFYCAYLLTKSWWAAGFSFFVYSLAPTYILTSRYALIENFLIPLSLLVIIFLQLFKQKRQSIWLILGGIATGLAISTKETGIFVLIMGLVILIRERLPIKKLLIYLIPGLIIGLIFYFYAFWLAPELWQNLFLNQANRGFFGPLNILYSASQLHFAGFPLDGFWLWGLILIPVLFFRKERPGEILIGFASYLLVLLIFAGSNYPWYYLPFIPFLVLASGCELAYLLKQPNIASLALFFLLPFSTALYWGRNVYRRGGQVGFYRLIIMLFLASLVVAKLRRVNWAIVKRKTPKFLLPIIDLFGWKDGLVFQVGWYLSFGLFLYLTYKWSRQGFQYIIANWNKLPEQFRLK
ncbi:MAG TPA: phospholipid carrier-dependent glycosyltransferase [Patescibacteria group bacterium]|nr:phospholipid carrier-dependent glycosyltransferase [Patescibacteria group bacterium]